MLRTSIQAVVIAALAAFALTNLTANAQEGVPTKISETVDILFSNDSAAVRNLLVTTQVECGGADNVDYTVPACPEGAADGTVVEAFPSTACEGTYQTSEQFDAISELLSTPGPVLVGTYHAPSDQIGLMAGDYVAVYTGIDGQSVPGGVWLTENGITGVNGGCPSPGSPIGTLEGFEEHFDLDGPISPASGLPNSGQGSSHGGFQQIGRDTAVLAMLGFLLVGISGALAFAGARRGR